VRSTDRHRMSPRRAAPAAMRARCTQAAARERLQWARKQTSQLIPFQVARSAMEQLM